MEQVFGGGLGGGDSKLFVRGQLFNIGGEEGRSGNHVTIGTILPNVANSTATSVIVDSVTTASSILARLVSTVIDICERTKSRLASLSILCM